MNSRELSALLTELRSHSGETEWIEFKQNNADPQEIGEYLSALSNSAALYRKEAAYIVWGVADESQKVVGTTFKPRQAKKGNEELENWLLRLLAPRIDVKIHEFQETNLDIVIFEIQPARHTPVAFSGIEHLRVGSLKKKLKEYPEKERALWAIFSETPFEKGVALKGASSEDVLRLIDYPTCFELLKQPLPDNRTGILDRLCREKVIVDRGDCHFDISNVGAILFAKNLMEFDRLARKALRVIQYKGKNRVESVREQVGNKGYAVGFEGAIGFINNLLPQNEQIEQALRRSVPVYPEIAIRELVANALIHQDFFVTGTGPMVEIFTDRIEITNPGTPLIDTLRFIDEPPQSRNEDLAALMRRMNICEERGSGIVKVILNIELFQLPAPEFVVTNRHTKAILFAPHSLNEMDQKDRVRACYQHACLRYVSNEQMTNSSLRDRLGVDQKNYATVSRIIRETIDEELVRPVDPNTSKRYMKYVPFWA
ncbi:MAG: ATP-binding protein [Pirellulaceae bacterium]